MHLSHISRAAAVAGVLIASSGPAVVGQTTGDITRVAYVTATDGQNAFVGDLTAADIVLKEAGKDREIVDVTLSADRMNIAILVEDSLTGTDGTRQSILDFINGIRGRGDVALYLVGRRAVQVQDYTTDVQKLVTTLNAFPINRPTYDENLVEAIHEVSQQLSKKETGRRVIVALAIERTQATAMNPDQALTGIRQSGVMLYAATVSGGGGGALSASAALDQNGRERVMGDGPKRSGGLRLETAQTAGFKISMSRFADELTRQYRVTYKLPSGVKPADRLSVTSKRRGVNVRAATHIPDK